MRGEEEKEEEGEGKGNFDIIITLGTNNQPPPLLCPTIYRFNDINQLLLILQHPVQLIIVARAEIAHHMLIAKKEHERHRVVELIHLFKIRHLIQVADVENREVFHSVGDSCWFFGC